MIACLPMYDRDGLRGATDALWGAIAAECRARDIAAPSELSRHDDYVNLWAHPDLLIGMTCGKPYRDGLYETASLIGTFDYALEGCPAGFYNSHIVVRADSSHGQLSDLKGLRFAFNGRNSESGYSCIDRMVDGIDRFAGPIIISGAHQVSAEMVVDGRADFAAIDAATWRYIAAEDAALAAQIRIVTSTPPVGGLPLITRQPELVPTLYAAVAAALHVARDAADVLGIRGVLKIDHEIYMQLKGG